MADLTVVAADVAAIKMIESLTGPTDEAIDAGEIVRYATATGLFTLANASSAAEGRIIGIAVTSGALSQTITVMKRGIIYLGDALDSETYDEVLYASNTDGKIDDNAGTPTADYTIGRVIPTWGTVTPGYALLVDVAVD